MGAAELCCCQVCGTALDGHAACAGTSDEDASEAEQHEEILYFFPAAVPVEGMCRHVQFCKGLLSVTECVLAWLAAKLPGASHFLDTSPCAGGSEWTLRSATPKWTTQRCHRASCKAAARRWCA